MASRPRTVRHSAVPDIDYAFTLDGVHSIMIADRVKLQGKNPKDLEFLSFRLFRRHLV